MSKQGEGWCGGKGAGIFFRGGSQIYEKVGVNKTDPPAPLFQQQKFYDPPPNHQFTLPQAKIVLKYQSF